jgi:outer membrane protein assembly factor BamA
VILRELLFKEGDALSDSLLNVSRERLENLWLFNRVEFILTPNLNEVTLIISVTERLYIFPFPIFTLDDRDWDKITYGFGITHTNFRGWNERIFAQIYFGNRPGYGFSYFNPWINRDLHLTAGVYFQKYSVQNHSAPFDEKHILASFSFGRYWTRDFFSKFSYYYDNITVPSTAAITDLMETKTKNETNNGVTLTTVYDKRDVYAYPTSGFYANLTLRKSGLFAAKIDYFQYAFDLRKYFSWKRITSASRIFLLQSTGGLPIYDRVYLGYSSRIRGHFNDTPTEGRHLFTAGQAFRFPLIKQRYYSLPNVFLPGPSTQNLKFGLNAGFFVETGYTWKWKNDFDTDKFISGYGMGLHFMLPYVEVLRFDMAFDEKFNHEFIMEILMPF